MITVIRLISDNYNCYVSLEAYEQIALEMSTGDYHTHRTRRVRVSPDTLQDIMWHRQMGYIDIEHRDLTHELCENGGDTEVLWAIYDGNGDCNYEPVYDGSKVA